MITRKNAVTRLKCATEKVSWGIEWEKIIYSDEKKFNMDSPDCWCHYWHDLEKVSKPYAKETLVMEE